MSEMDYQALARQFMDMWQGQMGKAMMDPKFMQSMLEVMQQMQMPMAGMGGAYAADRPAADAAEHSDGAVAELERRLAACEARIALLESELKSK